MVFWDIKKAFDAVKRSKVWETLHLLGINLCQESDITERIAEMYRNVYK